MPKLPLSKLQQAWLQEACPLPGFCSLVFLRVRTLLFLTRLPWVDWDLTHSCCLLHLMCSIPLPGWLFLSWTAVPPSLSLRAYLGPPSAHSIYRKFQMGKNDSDSVLDITALRLHRTRLGLSLGTHCFVFFCVSEASSPPLLYQLTPKQFVPTYSPPRRAALHLLRLSRVSKTSLHPPLPLPSHSSAFKLNKIKW